MSIDGIIVLHVRPDEFKFLLKTVDDQKNFIYKLGMNPMVKQETLRGLRIIENILKKSQQKESKHGKETLVPKLDTVVR